MQITFSLSLFHLMPNHATLTHFSAKNSTSSPPPVINTCSTCLTGKSLHLLLLSLNARGDSDYYLIVTSNVGLASKHNTSHLVNKFLCAWLPMVLAQMTIKTKAGFYLAFSGATGSVCTPASEWRFGPCEDTPTHNATLVISNLSKKVCFFLLLVHKGAWREKPVCNWAFICKRGICSNSL